jgi:hypothetical protein
MLAGTLTHRRRLRAGIMIHRRSSTAEAHWRVSMTDP